MLQLKPNDPGCSKCAGWGHVPVRAPEAGLPSVSLASAETGGVAPRTGEPHLPEKHLSYPREWALLALILRAKLFGAPENYVPEEMAP